MKTGEFNKEVRTVSSLVKYKQASRATIEQVARLNIWRRQTDIESKFTLAVDKKTAKKLFDDYLSNYEFDSFSDINTLADLVFEEVLKYNIQKQINKATSDKNTNFISDKTIKSLHDVEERVLKLKDSLGINKQDDKEDDLTALQKQEKRFDRYINFNRNEFTFVCPECKEPTLIRRRCDNKNFELLKHPFFSGRFYYNSRGMSLVKNGIWTKEQYAWVFHTHPDYVEWCIKHESEIPEVENFSKEEVTTFVKKNPFLRKDKIPKTISGEK